MNIIADLHLHSKYARAVSQKMIIPGISKWAKIKGINLVAVPDWTHPVFFREVKESLKPVAEGIFVNRQDPQGVFFALSTEISSIYSQGGRTRRIHNLVLAPSLKVVERISTALEGQGANLLSDGRPIIGLSSLELCELIFSISKDCLVIPAHAWTPWYSLYGSKSGFDSIKECYGSFADRIYAIETGLSSDPKMNWRIGELDSRTILSFSDAHSPPKIGREAVVFKIPESQKLTFASLSEAIKKQQIAYTIEFYPQEGKYHYTGHRKCKVKHAPEETKKLGKTCPVCGRELTIGVMHRVEELATRSEKEIKGEEVEIANKVKGIGWQNRPPYVTLVPLMEILAEALNSGVSSQRVQSEYQRLTKVFKNEFFVLLHAEIKDITQIAGEKVAWGIKRVRERDLVIDPGYDGVFGKVKIWGEEEKEASKKQMSLF